MQVSEIISAITTGDLDENFEQIRSAIRTREKFLAEMATATLAPGDTVRFSSRISPKYLIGLEATVTKINRESVVVNCPDDPRYGRFRNSQRVRCPNTLIEGLA